MVQFDSRRLADFCRGNGIVRLRMFGSAARGEDRPDSDVDLIADFGAPVGFFELIRAEDELAVFFGRPVDLLTERAISPFMRDSVLKSARVIFDAGA
ncbi:MAG: nucleotidyltransferase family protein [Longimicrobiales bacterium]